MIRISITAAAFEAISATMPLGSIGFEPEHDARASARSGLAPSSSPGSEAMRGPGESYNSDVIRRLAEG